MSHSLETHYLSVGQGDCSLIIVRDKSIPEGDTAEFDPQIVRTVVYDCGNVGGLYGRVEEFNTYTEYGKRAGKRLLEKCSSLGVSKIDVVVISHFDADHYNGLYWLFNLKEFNSDLLGEEPPSPEECANIMSLFRDCKIYSIGLLYEKNGNFLQVINNSRDGYLPTLASYARFLERMQNFKKKLKLKYPDNTFEHKTERVISGYPKPKSANFPYSKGEYFINETLSKQQYKNKWWPVTPKDGENQGNKGIKFESPQFLLGKDLLNDSFDKKIPINLICLAVNGYCIEKFEKTNGKYPIAKKLSDYTDSKDYSNETSLACLLKFNNYTAWFGGDAESLQEDACINSIKKINENGLTVLKASHHGSNHSTSGDFLKELNPHIAVITCGGPKSSSLKNEYPENIHGHPGIQTMDRLIDHFDKNTNPHDTYTNSGIYTTWCSNDKAYFDIGVPNMPNVLNGLNSVYITDIGEEGDIIIRLSEEVSNIDKPGNFLKLTTNIYYAYFERIIDDGEIRILYNNLSLRNLCLDVYPNWDLSKSTIGYNIQRKAQMGKRKRDEDDVSKLTYQAKWSYGSSKRELEIILMGTVPDNRISMNHERKRRKVKEEN